MRFWITKNSEIPLREQLVRQVTLGILSEDLPAGKKLPSVRALARRHAGGLAQPVRVADLHIDLAAHRVRRGGRTLELTAKEFALLEVLVLNRDAVVTRAAITAPSWRALPAG